MRLSGKQTHTCDTRTDTAALSEEVGPPTKICDTVISAKSLTEGSETAISIPKLRGHIFDRG